VKYKLTAGKDESVLARMFMALVVFGATLLISISGWYLPIQSALLTVSAPVLRVTSQVVTLTLSPVRGALSGVRAQEKIQKLSAETSLLHAKVAQLEYAQEENEALKSILENSDRTLDEMRIATPILSLSYPAIGVGKQDGVLVNQSVVLSGTVIGTVSEVYATQSRVSLFSSQLMNPLLVRTESGAEGVVIGDGRNVVMRHIPREIKVVEGERVFTIGQEGIRKNMFVGKISRVTALPSSPTQEAVIDQYVSFYDALLVEVWQ